MTSYNPGTHRLYRDAATVNGLVIPAGTILVVPSELEQESWRNLKAPEVSPEG